MAYDGFYGDLSTRGTANQTLTDARIIRDAVVASENNVRTLQRQVTSSAALASGSADRANAGAATALTAANNAGNAQVAAENARIVAERAGALANTYASNSSFFAGQSSDSAAAAARSAIEAANNSGLTDIKDRLSPDKGASLVGFDNTTVADQLLSSRKVSDYSAARNYTGPASRVEVTNSAYAGSFTKRAFQSGDKDDNGTMLVSNNGAFTLVRDLTSLSVRAEWFGGVGDGKSRPLSTLYPTLAIARLFYPHAQALTDELDWAAMQAAMNSRFQVEVGKSIFLCNRSLTSVNKNITMIGQGTELSQVRFTSQVDYGIRVTQNSSYESNIANIWWSTSLLNNGKAMSISYVGFAGIYERNKRFGNILNNRVSGVDYFNQGWKTCFEFDECTLLLIERNFAVGYRNLNGTTPEGIWWPFTEYGFIYKSSSNLTPTDALYNSNDVRYAKTAYQELGTLEGVRYNDCLAVACKYGIMNDRRELSGPINIHPWTVVTNCHLNVSAIGVYTNYVYQGFITDNLIYQFIYVDEEFVGISTKTGNNQKVDKNHISCNPNSAFTNRGIKVQQNNRSVVSFNEIEGCDIPIECSGTDGIVGTRFFMNRGFDKSGNETTPVVYTNGASPYDNPASNPMGIVKEGSNAATVAIAANDVNTLATISLDAFPAGSVFRICALCQVTKGGTTGTTKLYVEKTAGAATVSYMANSSGMGVQNDAHVAGTNWQGNLAGIIKKTSSGQLSIKLALASNGSNASVAAGDSQYVLERIV